MNTRNHDWHLVVILVLTNSVAFMGAAMAVEPNRPSLSTRAYSFHDEDSGGVAIVEVDLATRRLRRSRVLFDLPECRQPTKVRISADGQRYACLNIEKSGPHLFVWHQSSPSETKSLALPALPDEMRVLGDLAIITCENDTVVFVDLATNTIVHTDDFAQSLTPPGCSAEDIFLVPDTNYAVVSLQKDNKSGTKQGNRLVIYDVTTREHVADLQLPRDHPELHIESDKRERGPGPEVIAYSKRHDLLITTLDLYGAIAATTWSAALQKPQADWRLTSTSAGGGWGTSFPDRATLLSLEDRDYYLVCNSGARGGCVLIDLATQSVVWKHPMPPGMEAPIFMPASNKAITVCSGKTKRRTDESVEKSLTPQQSVYIMTFSVPDLSQSRVQSIHMPGFARQITHVSESTPWLLVACGQDALNADTLVLFDSDSLTILDYGRAFAPVQQFALP